VRTPRRRLPPWRNPVPTVISADESRLLDAVCRGRKLSADEGRALAELHRRLHPEAEK
jgi:hypothetical protein